MDGRSCADVDFLAYLSPGCHNPQSVILNPQKGVRTKPPALSSQDEGPSSAKHGRKLAPRYTRSQRPALSAAWPFVGFVCGVEEVSGSGLGPWVLGVACQRFRLSGLSVQDGLRFRPVGPRPWLESSFVSLRPLPARPMAFKVAS